MSGASDVITCKWACVRGGNRHRQWSNQCNETRTSISQQKRGQSATSSSLSFEKGQVSYQPTHTTEKKRQIERKAVLGGETRNQRMDVISCLLLEGERERKRWQKDGGRGTVDSMPCHSIGGYLFIGCSCSGRVHSPNSHTDTPQSRD